MRIEIKIDNISLSVTGDYEEGEQEVWTLPNGDPGYPGSESAFEINTIEVCGVDISGLLSEEKTIEIEKKCLMQIEK